MSIRKKVNKSDKKKNWNKRTTGDPVAGESADGTPFHRRSSRFISDKQWACDTSVITHIDRFYFSNKLIITSAILLLINVMNFAFSSVFPSRNARDKYVRGWVVRSWFGSIYNKNVLCYFDIDIDNEQFIINLFQSVSDFRTYTFSMGIYLTAWNEKCFCWIFFFFSNWIYKYPNDYGYFWLLKRFEVQLLFKYV